MKSKYSKLGVRGFGRVQLVDKDTGKIVGDSGYFENTVTNNGLNNACAGASIKATGSYAVGYCAIGTRTDTVSADQTDIGNRQNAFKSVDASTVATGTARCTCSFDGSDNSATLTIAEIGLFKTDSAGSLIATQTFTTSQMTTDQTLNATYELRFS